MIPIAFAYERATSLDDAVAKLVAANGTAKLIAGGHSLVPLMKLRLSEPQVLIDIARIPSLSGVREKDGTIEIGAGTVHHNVATSALLRQQCPVVSDAAAEIGDPQVRNRGTLGGNLAHADPSADYPAVMLAVDADIHVKGPKGWRVAKARDFFKDGSSRSIWRRTRSSRASSSPRCERRPTPSSTACLALRHRRRGRRTRSEQRQNSVGTHRAHGCRPTRDPPDERRGGLGGTGALHGDHRGGRQAGRNRFRGGQRRHPRQPAVPPSDDPRLHPTRAGTSARTRLAPL